MITIYELRELVIQFLAQYFAYFAAYRGIKAADNEDPTVDGTPPKEASPEEQFGEKILAKEYDEAIEIARQHGLNTDLVYQIQWKETPVSSSSIALYLKRVTDPVWVLNECISRVAESVDGQRLLLNYGIELTRNDQYITVEEHKEATDEDGQPITKKIRKRIDVNTLNQSQLTADQHRRIVTRCRLLHYVDRLNIIEHIIGTTEYDQSFYQQFREDSILSCARTFARASNFKAIAELFTYVGNECLNHWLPILSNFPECRSPFDYRVLMPECNLDGDVVRWLEEPGRTERDWSEEFCQKHCPLYDFSGFEELFYEEQPELKKFRGRNLTRELLIEWFIGRAKEIESRTGMVYYALDLLKLGVELRIPGLSDLHDHMETFALIVYECFPRTTRPNILNFEDFTALSDNEVITLLMLGANESERSFLLCIKHYLMPFLEKRDRLTNENRATEMLVNYLIGIGKNDLSLVRAVFEDCVRDPEKKYEDGPIFTDVRILLQLALDVIYASVQEDQLEEAFKIVECLPQRVDDCPKDVTELQDKIDDLEKHLAVSELLESYEIYIRLGKLRSLQSQSSVKEVKELFNRITRMAPKMDKSLKPTPFGERDWLKLLNDLQTIHRDCFANSFPLELVNEMLLNSLLTINLRGNLPLINRLLASVSPNIRLQVVLSATRHYLDSAGNTSDDTIMLAKECLSLLSNEEIQSSPEAREEQDFIEAMGLLDKDFDVRLLPVQMRLMDQPRISLLKAIIRSTRQSHKKFELLLRIARLLRIATDRTDRQRDALVLNAVGEAAFESHDKAGCWKICEYIMRSRLSEAANICFKLAKDNIASTARDRAKLLNFTLTYCEGSLISEVLDIINANDCEFG